MKNITFKRKVILLLIATSIIPLVIVSVILYQYFKTELIAKTTTTIETYNKVVSYELKKHLEDKKADLLMFSKMPIFYESINKYYDNDILLDSKQWKDITSEVDRVSKLIINRHGLETLIIVNKEGLLVYDPYIKEMIPLGTNIKEMGEKLDNARALEEALNGNISWSNHMYLHTSGQINFFIAAPIRDKGDKGEVTSAMYLSVSQDEIEDIIKSNIGELENKAQVYMVNKQGNLKTRIDNNTNDYSFLEENINNDLVKKFKSIKEDKTYSYSDVYDNGRGQKVLGNIITTKLGYEDVALLVEVPYEEVLAPIKNFTYIIFAFIIFCIILFGFVAYRASMEIIKPIDRIIAWSKRLAAGDYKEYVPDDSKHELLGLEENIREMAIEINTREEKLIASNEELEASYGQLTAFSEEVSRLNEELEHQAYYDSLTNLFNRRSFLKLLTAVLDEKQKGAILMLDLDNFKEINDTYGHTLGDCILISVGKRLSDVHENHENIIPARYGGDEFLIYLKDVENKKDIQVCLDIIKEALKPYYEVDDMSLVVNYSVGITIFPEDGQDEIKLISNADTAMYKAKKSTKNKFCYYEMHMHEKLKEKQSIKTKLQDALVFNEFELVYQPQIDIRENKIVGYEALLRLKDKSLSPGEFIPIAEESSLIIDIGRWVTKEVCRQINNWEKEGFEVDFVAINFSGKQLEDLEYLEYVKEQINYFNIKASQIEIELTEGMLMEKNKEAIQFVEKLKDFGIKLALDDFGSGYASLNYLTYLPINKIKFDRDFNQYFLHSESKSTIKQMINLFHSMGSFVLFEGIEEEKDVKILKEYDCDYIQGYYYSMPLDKEEVKKFEV